ncbi:hypothetical protein [Oceanicoccus sp. KOV_DT_Chl]|uniref:hypothetical protein n=1 Tax=Oceanicoccus sp. KOV_DT_Chl TaxID=1904639 RepID=UPI0011AF650C|nr:hypothetical protein [Oceanicoccus sp. KOV_DT_Chl]
MSFIPVYLFLFLLSGFSLLLGLFVLSLKRSYALAAFFFCNAIHAGMRGMRDVIAPELVDYSVTFNFLYGFLFFFTIQELLQQGFKYRLRHLAHLLPFVLIFTLKYLGYIGIAEIGLASCIVLIAYVFACYSRLNNYRKLTEVNRATALPQVVVGLYRAVHIISAIVLFQTIRIVVATYVDADVTYIFDFIFAFVTSVLFGFFVFIGLKSSGNIPDFDDDEAKLLIDIKDKDVLSGINADRGGRRSSKLMCSSSSHFLTLQ